MIMDYSSELFKFVVEGEPIYIDRGLVASASKPLERLVNGYMSEALNGEAVLQDVDKFTFARFRQWAYEGYYDAECHRDRPKSAATNEQKANPAPTARYLEPLARFCKSLLELLNNVVEDPVPTAKELEPLSSLQKSTPVSPGSNPHVAVIDEPFEKGKMSTLFSKPQICEAGDARTSLLPRANSSPSEDYTGVFLSHARVYVFAEQFDIQPLKRLALDMLDQTLSVFVLWPECVGDIIALIRFVYTETLLPFEGPEPLRDMLMRYVSLEICTLTWAPDFQDLLIEFADLVEDYCSCVTKRLKSDQETEI